MSKKNKTELDTLLEYLQEDKVVLKAGEGSEKEWQLMRKASGFHVKKITDAVARMVNDEGDSFEDTLSHHYNIDFPYPRQYLLEELIKRLQEMV